MALIKEDLQAIAEIVADKIAPMERSMNERFDSMEKSTNERFDSMEKSTNERFASLNERFDSMEKSTNERFVSLNERFDSMEESTNNHFKEIDGRLEVIEYKEGRTHEKLNDLSLDLNLIKRDFRKDIRSLQDAQDTLVEVLKYNGILPLAK